MRAGVVLSLCLTITAGPAFAGATVEQEGPLRPCVQTPDSTSADSSAAPAQPSSKSPQPCPKRRPSRNFLGSSRTMPTFSAATIRSSSRNAISIGYEAAIFSQDRSRPSRGCRCIMREAESKRRLHRAEERRLGRLEAEATEFAVVEFLVRLSNSCFLASNSGGMTKFGA